MKNCTQTLKRNYLSLLFLLFFATVFGQNAIVGTGFSTGWGGLVCPTGNVDFKYLAANAGTSYGVTSIANGTGEQFFRFGVDWSGTTAQLTKTIGSDDVVLPNTTYALNTSCTTAGAMKYNVPNVSYNYVFKTLNAGTNPTGTFVFFEVQGAVRSVSTVTQSPLAANVPLCSVITVTASLDGALSTGQQVYLRYTKDGYVTSNVVPLTGSGTTYTGTIPSSFNTFGANVSYYVFTSGNSSVALDGSNADLYTINLNNNGGSNYSYAISNIGTTAIPDPNFEQALINLGYDCAIDGQVLTSNISSVISLSVSGKNISSLVGINDFINLKYLDCANNALTSLNISGLTNLWELVANNNLISSLDVSSSPDLYFLDCERNQINSLNISGLTKLQTLILWVNNLTTLDVSTNPNLTYLDCDDNLFTEININGLTNLEYFYCSYNELTTINVSAATNLIEFNCNDNILDIIDVRGLTELSIFDCSTNPLTCILVDNVEVAIEENDLGNWTKDLTANYSYCNCSLTTTWDGSSWNPVAPTTGTYAAIIDGDYINIPANINACSLTVNNGAIVIIPPGTNVTLNAPLIVDSGSTFVLNNNANLIQTNKNSVNTGNISVIRDSSPLFRLDYTLWSSPVSGTQTLGEFSPSTVSTRFYEYNTTTDLYNEVPSTSLFSQAKGYLIRMPNTWVDYIVSPPSTPLSWPGTFTGTPNNGDITYVMSTLGNGYNAVGNPYPSPINMTQFASDNAATITQTLYFWRKTNGLGTAYCTWTPAVSPATGTFVTNSNAQSVDPLGILQTGQGFFVKASAPGSVTFKNTQRGANTAGQFFKTKQLVDNGRIWLNATNSTGDFSQMAVTYSNIATQGLDIYDGKYINDSPIALTSNINGEEYTIQGRPAFDVSDVVALNFKTNVAGNYSIAIDHVDGLFSGSQDIILKDNTTGAETDLKAGAYNFTAAVGTDNTRFSLKYQKSLKVDALAFNENSVTVYKNKGTLVVDSGIVDMSNIKVFDIQGRLIAEKKNLNTTIATINNLKITNQVLIVKITSQDNKVVSKKVVN